MAGEIWILWTIRLSMFCYALFLACLIMDRPRSLQRWLWTLACLFFLFHFVAAFQLYHGWSHTHAFEDTAKKTLATIGISFGAGIFFSYLFLILWMADTIWWWASASGYQSRDARITGFVQGFIFFIAFNGTIVFEDGAIRWAAILTCLGLAALLTRRFLLQPIGN